MRSFQSPGRRCENLSDDSTYGKHQRPFIDHLSNNLFFAGTNLKHDISKRLQRNVEVELCKEFFAQHQKHLYLWRSREMRAKWRVSALNLPK